MFFPHFFLRVDSLPLSTYISYRVPHIPAGAVSRVAAEAGVLLLKYNTSLQLWRLGQNPNTLLNLLSTTVLTVLGYRVGDP
jgi:hypothetical protein